MGLALVTGVFALSGPTTDDGEGDASAAGESSGAVPASTIVGGASAGDDADGSGATDEAPSADPGSDDPADQPIIVEPGAAPGGNAPVTVPADLGPQRDAWLRPFTSNSIWNTPIGADAVYVPADLPRFERHLLEHTTLMRIDPDDPLRPIIRRGTWNDRCSGTEPYGRSLNLPDGWQPREVNETATPNNPGVFLQPDGRTLVYLNTMDRCSPDGALYAQWSPDDDKQTGSLYGDGRLGFHGGSNLNQMGGVIRPGELDGDEPITHALDLLIWSEHLYWGGTKESSYRWPATTSDSYAGPERYRGDNPELRMGSLLALAPDLTPDDLGIDTDVGRKLFAALQDYGAYVTDDAAWEATYLGVDSAAIDSFAWGDAERDDMADLVANLSVVANNSPDTTGGGGRTRQPLLPELVPPS